LLPVALFFVLWNYLLRFAKWHYYLAQIGVRSLPLKDSALLFLGGLSMVVTPGRVGEWLKSYLLRELTGTAFSASAPIIIAERLTDALSMLVLASVGLLAYGYGWQMLLAVFLGAAFVVYLTQDRVAAKRLFALARPLPGVEGRVSQLRVFYDSSYLLFRPRSLAFAVGLGVASWFGECVAFFWVLVGLGLPATPELVLQATFILAVATIVGSVSMLPGGLAAAEGSIAGLLVLLAVTGDPATAAAATLLVRLCTLWFGVVVGVLALLRFAPRLAKRGVRMT
ncbi:MAG: lysylphosphatidylglycerol synthase transmembrane domain-containing protein, partial [Chloroflexota bacterium]